VAEGLTYKALLGPAREEAPSDIWHDCCKILVQREGATKLHTLHGCHMCKVALLVLVVTGLLFSPEALAQDLSTTGKLAKERDSVTVRALEKPAKKDDSGGPSLKNDGLSIQIQTPDIMTYLLENKGKIPLLSGMNGKLQLELGLFGYIGLKYQF
jgi:hypothetical protein